MVITEKIFSELVMFIITHPTWRHKLIGALYPDIDIVKALQDLAESQQQTQLALQELTGRVSNIETDVAVLKDDVAVLKEDVAVLKKDVAVLKTDMAQVKHDVAHLKGFNYESRFIQRADSIFGRFMRRGRNAKNEIGNLLEEAEDNGIITEREHDHVLVLDLLWGGKQKRTKADIVLAIEVSWRAEQTDIERAVARAEVLRKMDLTALPVVAGLVWDDDMIYLARQRNVVMAIDMTIDDASWQNAF